MPGAFYALAFDNDAFEVDTAVSASASQTVDLPTPSATVSVEVSAAGNQTIAVLPTETALVLIEATQDATVPLPSQTAAAETEVAFVASQIVARPLQSATLFVEGSWTANQTVPAPAQAATATVIVSARTGREAAFEPTAFGGAFLVTTRDSQIIEVPDQIASLYIGPADFSGSRSIPVPSQTATGKVITLLEGSIYINVPMPSATGTVLVQGASSKTIEVPQQNAVSYNPTTFVLRRKIARRQALPLFIARSDRKPLTSRRPLP